MGYRYQNKLDEENERRYWEQFPPWRRKFSFFDSAAFYITEW